MDIIITSEVPAFDTDKVQRGGFIRAKHFSWQSPRNALVAFVKPARLTCLYLVGVNATVKYFNITADEVAAGDYEILIYSNTLEG